MGEFVEHHIVGGMDVDPLCPDIFPAKDQGTVPGRFPRTLV